jgi:hypothetical protein
MIKRVLFACAALTMVLAVLAFAGSFGAAPTPSWPLLVRELTLHAWRSPGAPDFRPALPLDNSDAVGRVSVASYTVRNPEGFQVIEPFAPEDSRRCALHLRRAEGMSSVALHLSPESQVEPRECDSMVQLKEAGTASSAPLKAGEEVIAELASGKTTLGLLRKSLRASSVSFVVAQELPLADRDSSCKVAAGSRVTFTGPDLSLSQAELGPDGLLTTIEAKGKVSVAAGEYCKLELGSLKWSGWLWHISALVTAITVAFGIFKELFEEKPPSCKCEQARSKEAASTHEAT